MNIQEKQTQHFIKWLKTWRKSKFSNARAFEQAAGLPVASVHKYTTGTKPKAATLKRCILVAKELGYEEIEPENQRINKKKAK